jgi:hypothetical protein
MVLIPFTARELRPPSASETKAAGSLQLLFRIKLWPRRPPSRALVP